MFLSLAHVLCAGPVYPFNLCWAAVVRSPFLSFGIYVVPFFASLGRFSPSFSSFFSPANVAPFSRCRTRSSGLDSEGAFSSRARLYSRMWYLGDHDLGLMTLSPRF